MPLPKVSLIVLNWNNWRDTRECLASLAGVDYRPLDTIAVDNGSADGSPDRIAEEFPSVSLLRLPENRGYGGGMNAGIEAALAGGSDFILCLNNDMTVDPLFLESLVQVAAEGKTVPFPALYQGEHSDRLDNAGNRLSFTGLTGLIGYGSPEIPPKVDADYTELPFLPSRLLERIGLYREDYFAFYEDVDLCLRIRAAGWSFRLVPESKIYHRRGSTTRHIPGLVSYYSVRNRLLLMRDNGGWVQGLLTALHALLALPLRLVEALTNPASKHSPRHLALGFADGLLPWRRGIKRVWPRPA